MSGEDFVRPDGGGFRLDKGNGALMGVCSGIARRTGWGIVPVRLAFVAGTLLGFGVLVPIYLTIGLIAR